MNRPGEGRGHWNRAARRSGGNSPTKIPVVAGTLVGVFCAACGAEAIAVAPGIEPRCLRCGARWHEVPGEE